MPYRIFEHWRVDNFMEWYAALVIEDYRITAAAGPLDKDLVARLGELQHDEDAIRALVTRNFNDSLALGEELQRQLEEDGEELRWWIEPRPKRPPYVWHYTEGNVFGVFKLDFDGDDGKSYVGAYGAVFERRGGDMLAAIGPLGRYEFPMDYATLRRRIELDGELATAKAHEVSSEIEDLCSGLLDDTGEYVVGHPAPDLWLWTLVREVTPERAVTWEELPDYDRVQCSPEASARLLGDISL